MVCGYAENKQLSGDAAPNLWHVYLVSCIDGTLYTGVAKDVSSRIEQHNLGLGAKYTRGRTPVKLVYCESVGGRGDALRREIEIKRLSRSEKLRLVAGYRGA